MSLDRQSIERRDFPIGRRGYEPAAVDSHLRSLAAEVAELERTLDERQGAPSLGSAAGGQVRSILEAAEATAADIQREASTAATAAREQADADAARTRGEAVARAQAHVQAVSEATAALLSRVESMDREAGALVQSLRDGAGRLAADLRALEGNMGELYDAAAAGGGHVAGAAVGVATGGGVVAGGGVAAGEGVVAGGGIAADRGGGGEGGGGGGGEDAEDCGAQSVEGSVFATPPPIPPAANGTPAPPAAAATPSVVPSAAPPSDPKPVDSGDDLDGARLIALNMALNGEPREQADRYLAENFELSDREKLLDEVYAAIEG